MVVKVGSVLDECYD